MAGPCLMMACNRESQRSSAQARKDRTAVQKNSEGDELGGLSPVDLENGLKMVPNWAISRVRAHPGRSSTV